MRCAHWPKLRSSRCALLASHHSTLRCLCRGAALSVAAAQPACVAPLALALWVSASRIHDYAHSAGDVVGGLALGAAFGAVMLLRTAALDRRVRHEAAALLS